MEAPGGARVAPPRLGEVGTGGAVRLVALSQVRRRWAGLLVLGLLTALVSGAVLAGLTGARRTATTLDRFRDWSRAADLYLQVADPSQLPAVEAVVSADPGVAATTERHLVNAFPTTDHRPDFAVFVDPSGELGTSIDRPRLLEGRLPDDGAPDEIVINELVAQLDGLRTGSTIEVQSFSRADIESLSTGAGAFTGVSGPTYTLTVVGVAREPSELPGKLVRDGPAAIASTSFLAAHPDVGSWPPVVLVRGTDAAAVDRLGHDVQSVIDTRVGVGEGTERGDGRADQLYVTSTQRAINGSAWGLVAFAAVAAVAGGAVLAQTVSRQLAATADEARTLSALGLHRRPRAVAIGVPSVVALTAGIVLGGVLAFAASPLLPLGVAGRAEITPGPWFDPLVTLGGAVLLVAGAALWTFRLAGRVGERGRGAPVRPATSFRRRLAQLLGAAPSLGVGVGYAVEPGRGGRSLRTRSAMVGLAVAVAGLVGSGVMVRSLDQLTSDPGHWGWNWSSAPDALGEQEFSEVAAGLAVDERLSDVGLSRSGPVVIDGTPMSGYSMEVIRGHPSYTAVDGRLPAGPGEVALGAATRRALGVSTGDVVTATRVDGSEVQLTVVGTAAFPPLDVAAIDVGAALTEDGLGALAQEADSNSNDTPILRFAPGVDVDAVKADLSRQWGLDFNPFTEAQVPGPVRYVAELRDLMVAIGVFFVGVGVLALLHTMVLTGRRRRPELAVLRTLGLRRRGVRGILVSEALAIGLIGLVVGIPVGLVAGRAIWRAMTGDLGVVADPAAPVVLIAVLVPAVVVLAVLVSAWPSWSVLRRRPAAALRTE